MFVSGSMRMILERLPSKVACYLLGHVSPWPAPAQIRCMVFHALETPEDETSPGDGGNSPDADPNAEKNAGGEGTIV